MNEAVEQVLRAQNAQKQNCIPTPDEFNWRVILRTAMSYSELLGGFVARQNTFLFRNELKRAGFVWDRKIKAWIKPVPKKGIPGNISH
ncbi:MAG: hypothetical protein JXB42_10380 [Deltaproteobacteria bacterium]|nr:hypothetical protein [Deltaproteobacteria bacterium]